MIESHVPTKQRIWCLLEALDEVREHGAEGTCFLRRGGFQKVLRVVREEEAPEMRGSIRGTLGMRKQAHSQQEAREKKEYVAQL